MLLPLVVLLVLLPACGDDGDDEAAGPTSTALEDRLSELSGAGVFVGGVAFTGNLVSIHFDDADDRTAGMKIFVTDGLPGGNAEWFEGTAPGGTFKLTSTSGQATVEGEIEDFETDGQITLAGGVVHNFFTRPAGDGAGTFEVTIGADGGWTGTSVNGSTLTARQTGNYVEGAVVSSAGERYPFRHNDLSRRLGYSVAGGAPGRYLTIVTRQATEIQGRGGDVEGGKPDDNVIALDLSQEATPTPGVYHGRVAMSTDRLNFELVPEAGGSRLVRVYLSDSEPEPAGDIQWWAESVTGATFSMMSKMGDATITGTIADDGITGDVTLTDGVTRKYFVAPSGQGAGIYTVEVASDRRHTGTSEQGATLDLVYQNGTVMGTLTSPDGEEYPMLGADLAGAYRYTEEYSKPGTYTAFVAPRGRYVYGRNGNVRGGGAGLNIIGLDKKC
ncbi:MAG TPA: hypothetical protein VF244_00840 [Acidimicrobiales bacterium]